MDTTRKRKSLAGWDQAAREYGELIDSHMTSGARITRILNFESEEAESIERKTVVFLNPNATAKHVQIALDGNSQDVLLSAIQSQASTNIQVLRGISILETKFNMSKEEIKKILMIEIKRYGILKSSPQAKRVVAGSEKVLSMLYKQ